MMKNDYGKRILALILAVAMVVTMMAGLPVLFSNLF